jgi:probable F420-dependent oxidoreductase
VYKRVLDPLETLTFVAAHTHHIALGTSVLNLPWYPPVQLARRLTTLDVLSGGRLRVGFGMGWSLDEYEAAGASWQERGKRADELIDALKTIWTTDPVEFKGEYYRIPKSFIGPKPVQKPHPPIYMAAYTPPAMKRVAKEANGWFPVGIPLAAVGQMFEGIKGMAQQAGRDPAALELLVRANVEFSDTPVTKDRVDFTGAIEQIAGDVAETRKLAAAEIVFDVQFSPGVKTVDDIIARMEGLCQVSKQA